MAKDFLRHSVIERLQLRVKRLHSSYGMVSRVKCSHFLHLIITAKVENGIHLEIRYLLNSAGVEFSFSFKAKEQMGQIYLTFNIKCFKIILLFRLGCQKTR